MVKLLSLIVKLVSLISVLLFVDGPGNVWNIPRPVPHITHNNAEQIISSHNNADLVSAKKLKYLPPHKIMFFK